VARGTKGKRDRPQLLVIQIAKRKAWIIPRKTLRSLVNSLSSLKGGACTIQNNTPKLLDITTILNLPKYQNFIRDQVLAHTNGTKL